MSEPTEPHTDAQDTRPHLVIPLPSARGARTFGAGALVGGLTVAGVAFVFLSQVLKVWR